MIGVLAQVRDELITRQVLRVASGNSEMGETGEAAHGVQVQPIVPSCPGTTDLRVLLQHDRIDAPVFERSGGRQSRRTTTDDNH